MVIYRSGRDFHDEIKSETFPNDDLVNTNIKNTDSKLWPGGLVGWSNIPYTKRLQVPSPCRAHTYVGSSVHGQGVYGRRLSNELFLSLSLPFSGINKHILA